MAGEINYKQKYLELKQKYMNSVDTAFRLGYEQGQQDAAVQQVQDQQAQMAEAQAAAEGGAPGQEGEPQQGQPGEEQPADSAHPGGSELDQHIAQLEGMLGKSELTGEDLAFLKKSVESIKFGVAMRKSDQAVKGIAKSLAPKPFKINKQAAHNMSPASKDAVNLQEKIVGDIMKSWEAEEANAGKSIADVLSKEGLVKKG